MLVSAPIEHIYQFLSSELVAPSTVDEARRCRHETTTHLEPHIVGDVSTCKEAPYKAEISIAGGWICDFDLLEAAFYDLLKEVSFLVDGHGICQGLVAVTEICREPDWRRFCNL